MRTTILALILLTTCAAVAAPPTERVVLGRISRITLLAPGVDDCPPKSEARQDTTASGTTVVVGIDNGCGCAKIDVQVEETFLGGRADAFTINHDLDEWCEPELPLGSQLLIRQRGEIVEWSAINRTAEGGLEFRPDGFTAIGDVALFNLPARNGWVSLDDLRRATKL